MFYFFSNVTVITLDRTLPEFLTAKTQPRSVLRRWGKKSTVKYMRNAFEQLDIRQLLFCLITLANVIEDSKRLHPFERICSTVRSYLSEKELVLTTPSSPPATAWTKQSLYSANEPVNGGHGWLVLRWRRRLCLGEREGVTRGLSKRDHFTAAMISLPAGQVPRSDLWCCCRGWDAGLRPLEEEEGGAEVWRWWKKKYTQTENANAHTHVSTFITARSNGSLRRNRIISQTFLFPQAIPVSFITELQRDI